MTDTTDNVQPAAEEPITCEHCGSQRDDFHEAEHGGDTYSYCDEDCEAAWLQEQEEEDED